MKKIFSKLLVLCSLTLLTASCIGDKGSYEYKDGATIMPVKISDLGGKRTIIYGDRVTIEPTLENNDTHYSYKWFTYPGLTNGSGNDAADIKFKKLICESNDSPVLDIFIASQADQEFPNVQFVNLNPGLHRLCLEVWDESLDLYKRSAIDLEVSGTEMQRGIYILKDLAAGGVDIDYIGTSAIFSGESFEPIPYDNNPNDNIPGEWKIISNVIQMQGEEPLPGTAVQIAYQRMRYPISTVFMESSSGKGLFVLSSEDMRAINPTTMKSLIWLHPGKPADDPDKRVPLDNMEDLMFVVPDVTRPQSISTMQQIYASTPMMYMTMLLVNDGKLYPYGTFRGGNDQYGKFLPFLLLRDVNANGTAYTGDYDLHPDIFMRWGSSMDNQTAVFDKTTRSVHYLEPYWSGTRGLFNNLGAAAIGTDRIPTDPGQDFVSLVKMDYDLVCMMPQDLGAQGRVFMLFKHITTGKHVLLRGAVTGAGHPLAGVDASLFYVPDNSLMLTAKARMATPFVGNFVFFGNGGKLGVYRHAANASESILKEFPGEDIAWLGLWPMSGAAGSGGLNTPPKLIVLSNDESGNYHVRLFNFDFTGVPTDPGIEPDPIFELTGMGKAHDAVIRLEV